MVRVGPFSIFNEYSLSSLLHQNSEAIKKEVNDADEDYILNVNGGEYTGYLSEKFRLEPLIISFDEGITGDREIEIPRAGVDFGRVVSKRAQVMIFRFPYEGNESLFRFRPEANCLVWTENVFLEDGYLSFEIIDEGYTVEEINAKAREIIKNLKIQSDNLNNDVSAYNGKIALVARDRVRGRKEVLAGYMKKREGLEIPFEKKGRVSDTFTIPAPEKKKKIKVVKPTVPRNDYKPEPTLSESDYFDILKLIHEAGREFERYPNTFKGMVEADLRNVLIVLLQTHFVGTATAETFNKEGKSDILLKYEGGVAFVAECKFWDGPKAYLESIDQILKYLTWRDSKAGLIVFVKNTDISTVISKISKVTSEHRCFISEEARAGDSWFNFRVALNNDPNTKASLAVLLFHIPS